MKQFLTVLIVCWTAALASAAEPQWFVDFEKAKEKAKTEKKLIFMNFTGSDWCPPCAMFAKYVASDPAFQAFAKNNLVLVEVDFPRRKPMSNEQRAANEALGAQMKASNVLPTYVVLDSDAKELKRFHYRGEDGKAFVAMLEKIKM